MVENRAGIEFVVLFTVALLGGIGFTVSLFIATLSFGADPATATLLEQAKLGIVTSCGN